MITLDRNALVWGVVGNLGGGKTMTAVKIGVDCLLNGYAVVSNVTFKIDEIARYYHAPWVKSIYFKVSLDDPLFDPFKIPCGDPRGSGGKRRVVVILDEVAEWIDQYTSAKDERIKRLWSWLRHSSKRSQDVVVICQRQEYINKVVRSLIARWIWVDDLAVYRMPKIRIKIPFCSGLVMQNVFDRLGNRIAGTSFIRKSVTGQFYDTAECLNLDGSSYHAVYSIADEKYRVSPLSILFLLGTMCYLLRLIL